jgi:hypothetical protein
MICNVKNSQQFVTIRNFCCDSSRINILQIVTNLEIMTVRDSLWRFTIFVIKNVKNVANCCELNHNIVNWIAMLQIVTIHMLKQVLSGIQWLSRLILWMDKKNTLGVNSHLGWELNPCNIFFCTHMEKLSNVCKLPYDFT